MNTCPNDSSLKCPYALSSDSPLPCFATEEECKAYKEGYKEL